MNFNPLRIVANIAEKACDAVLPKELEWVGDVVSLATNIRSGNVLGIIDDVKDLAQNVKNGDFEPNKLMDGLNKVLPFWTPPWTRDLIEVLTDPGAPPPASPAGAPPPASPTGAPPISDENAAQRAAEARSKSDFGQSEARAGSAASFTNEAPNAADDAEEATAKGASSFGEDAPKANATKAPRKKPKAETSAETKKTSAAPTKDKAAKGGGKDEIGLPKSDKEFMEMVRSGKLPDGIGKDPAAMATVQARLHEIQQMNTLVTNMLRAMHDMEMEIIRNMRA